MRQENIIVLRKIIYAVESGGQVYGRQDYSAFAGVGANTPNEVAITIGAGQWYAGEARRLLQLIRDKCPATFNKYDNAGIGEDLGKDWEKYGAAQDSAKGKSILAIISSSDGMKCQDLLMETQIKEYATSIEKTYGTMGDDAMMECINIIHQGGVGALKRILAKTKKPYTAAAIYAALNTDPADKSNTNQVGDYTIRQKKVYEMIMYHGVAETSTGKEAKVGVRMSNCGHDENNNYKGGKAGDQTGTEWTLRNWYAYPWNYIIRWKDASLGELFADLAVEAAQNNLVGYDQYQRDTFWTHLKASGYRPSKITVACEADCSSGTVALIKAVGYLKGIAALQNCSATYTGDMMAWFRTANGQKYFEVLTGKYLTDSSLARRGDINLNTAHHVNITVDNGANAGTVSSGGNSSPNSNGSSAILRTGSTGAVVKTLQTMLITCGYSCGASGADGEFGADTKSALKAFQKANGLEADGEYGPASRAKLEALYKQKRSGSAKKSIAEIAKEVIAGKWLNGDGRRKKLEAAGYDYNAVQEEVNRLLK